MSPSSRGLRSASLAAMLLTTGCAGARMELRPAPSPIGAIAHVEVDSAFALDASMRTALEDGVRQHLIAAQGDEPGRSLRVQLDRKRNHDDVGIGAHGETMAYDYVTYEIRVTVADPERHELASCRLSWDEADARVVRDARREGRTLERHLQEATRALLGDPQPRTTLIAAAH